MKEALQEALAAITAQQTEEWDPVWQCGEQLKDILRDEEELAPIVLEDLKSGSTLKGCEQEIEKEAKKHKMGGRAAVSGARAEQIIRTYFGLPERGAKSDKPRESGPKVLDLADFL